MIIFVRLIQTKITVDFSCSPERKLSSVFLQIKTLCHLVYNGIKQILYKKKEKKKIPYCSL